MKILVDPSDNIMTLENMPVRPSHPKNFEDVQRLKIIAFTHRTIALNDLSRFFIREEDRAKQLQFLKDSTGIDELMYIATCNRIEFVFVSGQDCTKDFKTRFPSSVT